VHADRQLRVDAVRRWLLGIGILWRPLGLAEPIRDEPADGAEYASDWIREDAWLSFNDSVLMCVSLAEPTHRGSSVLRARGWLLEGHLDHRSYRDEIIQGRLASVPTSSEMLQDLPASHKVCNGLGSGVNVETGASLQVHDDARIIEDVRKPVPPSRRPGDEEAAVDIEHPDFDSTRLT
jgi:hypothetical protein